MSSKRTRAYIYLTLVAIIWGAAGPVIKFTLEGIDPLPFLFYRLFIASIASLIFFAVKISKGKKFHQLQANLPMSILYSILGVPIALGILFLALDSTTVLDLTLIGIMGPLMVVLGGSIFFKERITKQEKTGIFIVLAGVIINSILPLLTDNSGFRLTGNILLLIFLVADAGSILIAKKLVRKKVKSANLTNLAFIIGFITIIPLALYFYGFRGILEIISGLSLKYHLGVWYMALLSGNLAYFLYVRAQRSIEVSEAVLFNYLQPFVMVPLAIFWLHEILDLNFIFGAVLVAIGLFIAERKKRAIVKKASK